MLVHIKDLIKKAQKDGYAVGAFNIFNLETALGVVRAASKLGAPAIIQVSETTIEYAGLKAITQIVEAVAKDEKVKVPIALHLDHGKSFRSVAECISVGFSSIHIDASELPFSENVLLTKQAVDYAHKHGVWAQGELGILRGVEDKAQTPEDMAPFFTDPEEAVDFVAQTSVDTLAVSIGNMHGIKKFRDVGVPDLDLLRLKKIHNNLPATPIVLHGASGIKKNQIEPAIELGVRIINIDTELRLAFTNAVREILNENSLIYDPRQVLTPAIAAIEKIVEEKIKMFGSAGRY
ncbi:MAG: class II fructose-bisphosphate aldolase [Patescibacteria group bacterium]|nr:class II fructose-bisphosphate aldolase [Patescibacteria group bacterium]